MVKRKRSWTFESSRQPKPKVSDSIKAEIKRKCDEFVESILKPKHIIDPPKNNHYNYIVEIYTKWYRNYIYFCAKYHSPDPNAISPFFELKFARMEYVDKDQFNLSYMRHTNQWFEIFREQSIDECIESIDDMPIFIP